MGLVRMGLAAVAAAGIAFGSGCSEDPFDPGKPRSCELPDRLDFMYDVMQTYYLWNTELPELEPTEYDSTKALMRDLRFTDIDRWSRVADKERSDALFMEGKFVGLGFAQRRYEDGTVRIAFVHHNSPAQAAGLRRGDRLEFVNSLSIAEIDEQDVWNEVFGASEPGVTITLRVASIDDGSVRDVSLTKDWVEIATVPVHEVIETEDGPVGYMLFAGFVDPAIPDLDLAFEEFRAAGVRDVIVDLRYNGGGRISVARHIIDLIVGRVANGHTSYGTRFNEDFSGQDKDRKIDAQKHSLDNPRRAVFITTRTTLSASELVINGVRPHVPTFVVGATTGGKPVGSKIFDMCDEVVVPITFQLVNAEEQGEYFDGLATSCPAADDLLNDFGNPVEASLAEAIAVAQTGACTTLANGDEGRPSDESRGGLDVRSDGLLLRGMP